MSVKLTKLTIRGYKSIRELENFEPGPLNVLIGVNGAGKSNFVSLFRLISWMLNSPGDLQFHVSETGGANAILHDGSETTPQMEVGLSLETEQGENDYFFRLFYAAGDTLVFADERFRYSSRNFTTKAPWRELGAGHREAKLNEQAEMENSTARAIRALLRQCVVHQFHNTSANSRMRGKWNADEGYRLREDAANLAPFLMRLRDNEAEYYHRIVETIRMIVPFFADFELEAEYGKVLLRWREQGSNVLFNASQASDGMLRLVALVALLGQPERDLPDILFFDEPELGLHPYAISVVAGMLQSVSQHSQVILATQSAMLVDQFEPEDIIVVERKGRPSEFRRLESQHLKDWLEEYSLGELWEKNVLGGRPA